MDAKPSGLWTAAELERDLWRSKAGELSSAGSDESLISAAKTVSALIASLSIALTQHEHFNPTYGCSCAWVKEAQSLLDALR